MGQKQSYEVSKEAAAVSPVLKESAEDEIKMSKAQRNAADAPVITPSSTPPSAQKQIITVTDTVEEHMEPKAEETKETEQVHILAPSGEMAEVHHILVTDEPKEMVAAH